MTKILITGGAGKIADALCNLPYNLTFTDIAEPNSSSEVWKHSFEQGDLNDSEFLNRVLTGKQVVVHLGGCSSPECSWENILTNNIAGTRNLFHAAQLADVDKIIFASSNRVYGFYEEEHEAFYHSSEIKSNKITENDPPRPNYYYSVSKLFGEDLGRFYSEKFGMQFISLRIGSVLAKAYDHPYGYARLLAEEEGVSETDPRYLKQVNRLKSTWMSRRDFASIVDCSIKTDCSFGIFNAISNNTRAWMSIDKAIQELKFHPADNAENWKEDKL